MSVIALSGLSRSFGGIVAADRIDFSLASGELHFLIGPNGAGKSTVFKLVMGLVRPQAGTILFEGHDITHMEAYRRVRLGLSMKYQTTRVFPNLTVAQNVTIARSRTAEADGLMDWALARFGLDRRMPVPASGLSYGEQHWLEMAMALGNGPRLVLMDEPTAGMTPEETVATGEFITELNGKGVAVIVIEHDMGFVRRFANRVTVLHQGRILRQGTVAEIERDPEVQRVYLGEHHA